MVGFPLASAFLFLLTPLREGRRPCGGDPAETFNFYSRPCGRGDRKEGS